MEQRWIEPLDVLYLRGNRLFGTSVIHADALMPPWPSMVAGALRSRMLVDAGIIDFAGYRDGVARLGPLDDILGSPSKPGSLRIRRFGLARRLDAERIEPLWPLPADRVVQSHDGRLAVHALEPSALPANVLSSGSLPMVPVLRVSEMAKPLTDCWLTAAGLADWQAGKAVDSADVIRQGDIWKLDPRLGIALDRTTGSTIEGKLYTTDAVALQPGYGFHVAVNGADRFVPDDGLLRLGGDGRGARVERVSVDWPEPDYGAIAASGRMRIMLTTPGLFAAGWRLPGLGVDNVWLGPDGVRARLCAVSAGRSIVVSGWDLAKRKPKPALRAVPAGSVFWLDRLEADEAALRKLADHLLPLPEGHDERKPEGFNQIAIAAWPDSSGKS